jgi:hypothetical protein
VSGLGNPVTWDGESLSDNAPPSEEEILANLLDRQMRASRVRGGVASHVDLNVIRKRVNAEKEPLPDYAPAEASGGRQSTDLLHRPRTLADARRLSADDLETLDRLDPHWIDGLVAEEK